MLRKATVLLLAISLLQACSDQFDPWRQDSDTGRWYSKEQVELGAKVYQANCAVCHGSNAEATPEWIKPDANGLYPPPPLNGTAHAWHHPFPILKKTIEEGSAGRMPAWKGKLSEQEVESVIAWFQSLWPDRGYQLWQQRHKK
ncbi:cytochrome c [Motiliproteus sp. MSK22-1]|uniref:c-type cytochrome n=1 Tax=Motiliproteus sp. MSK22-1 TaxID=1897630 RepID=UPI000975550E|nr:cytochrome c [Motiliproteus sp. MSK22-1]OMH31760.1 hypothetical protein BGP75_16730 [Motiliproteus sp. MSK22-1]